MVDPGIKNLKQEKYQFLSGGGEMGILTRAKDWSKTAVGSPDHWPQSLRTIIGVVLTSKFPMFLWWGSQLTCFYNDAYRPSLGKNGKHPNILGMPAQQAWPEIWHIIKPLIDQVMDGGEATWNEDQLIPIFRNGKIEDVYWTFSYSPVSDEVGKVGGVLVTCTETTEKVLTYKKLEENKDQLEFAIDAARLATWDYNPATNKFTCNNKLKEWFGLPQETEIELQHAIDAIAEKDRERIIKAIQKALDFSSGGMYEEEYSIIHPLTKKETIVYAKGKTIFNDQNQAYRFNGTLEDVTEQVNARKRIEESEKKFRTMAESADILIAVNDENAGATYFNKAWEKITGRPAEDLLNFGWADLLHPEDKQPFLDKFANAFANKQSYEGEFRVLDKYGEYRWLYATIPVRLHPDGSYAGHISSCIDITDLKKTETELKLTQQRLRSFVQSAPFPIGVYIGREMRIALVNDAILQAWGRSKDIVGKLYKDVLTELKGQGVYEQLDKVFTTGIAFHAKNQHLDLLVDGKIQPYYYNYSFTPLFDDEGNVYGILNTGADVTDLNLATKKIEASDKRFRDTLRQAPVGITILRGKNYMVEMANDAYLQLVDRKEAEFIGRPLFDSLPEVESTVHKLLDDVLDTGIPFNGIEYAIPVNRYGKEEIGYFNFVYHPLKEDDGSISGIIVTVTDVYETVMARHAVEKSEQRLRSFVKSAPFPIGVFTGKEMHIDLVNPSIIEVWGKGNDVIGKKFAEVLPELEGTGIYEQLDAVYTTGIPYHANNQRVDLLINNKIEAHYFNYSFTPVYDGAGIIYGVMNTAAEVTDLAIAKQKVEASEKEFRELADRLPELVWTTDKYGGQTFASVRWKEFTGLDPYDAGTFEKMMHPDDLQNLMAIWTNCLATGNIYKAQVRLKSKHGDYQWFYVHGEPIRNDHGEIEKWIGAFTNFNEQKKTEEELIEALLQIEESEKRFKNVANSAPVLIWLAGTDMMRYFFNTAWLNFTGRNLEQELGNGWAEAIHPEDFKKYLHHYITAFDKKEEFYAEYRLKRYDGEYRWVSVKGVPRFTADGEFEGFIGACMDIHERVIYQKKLKEDEERLNIIINASELGTWEFNLKTHEVQYSDRYLQIFGYDSWTELSHEKLIAHLHPDDLLVRKEAFERAFETGLLHYESRLIWNDKTVHWFEGKGKVFYDENNEPNHLIGTIRDITEEKYFQQELIAREKKFRLLADSMPEFVWTGDVKGNLNYFNQSVYNYTGLTAEQVEKDGWLQIVHPDDRQENIRLWMSSIENGTDFLFEHRFRRYDGKYHWQLSRATPQRDAEGNIQMWVGTSTDIQEIKEQDQQKDLFISMASHELKTPVTSIKGYVQILQTMYGGSNDTFLKNSLNTVDKQIVTLTNLISELLDLSKIKSGSLVMRRQNFSINQLVKETVEEIKLINPGYNISFSDRLETMVNADMGRIGQVLINLLNNAIKYSPDSPDIKVNAMVKDDHVFISVQDEGIGIDIKDQEKIFERFYRVEGKNENTFPGFGIGLFIASEIIKKHEGTIGVSSEAGKGSVFYFSIPISN